LSVKLEAFEDWLRTVKFGDWLLNDIFVFT